MRVKRELSVSDSYLHQKKILKLYSCCCSLYVRQVEPFASLAGAVRPSVPRLLINRDLVGPFAFRRRPGDVVQLGDVVGGVQELVAAIGWRREMDALMAPVRNGRKTAADVPPLPCAAHELTCVFMSFLSFSPSPGCSGDRRVNFNSVWTEPKSKMEA